MGGEPSWRSAGRSLPARFPARAPAQLLDRRQRSTAAPPWSRSRTPTASSAGARRTRCSRASRRRAAWAASSSAVTRRTRLANQDLVRRLPRGNGFATGALSIALDDLRARQLGVPRRARSTAAPSAGASGRTPRARDMSTGEPLADAWVAEAGRATEAGFLGFKLRIGRDPIAVELDAMRAASEPRSRAPRSHGRRQRAPTRSARRSTSAGASTTSASAGSRNRSRPTDYVEYERLRERLPLALAGGESLQHPRRCPRRRSIGGPFDLIQPDVSICGGIGETIAIAALARLAGDRDPSPRLQRRDRPRRDPPGPGRASRPEPPARGRAAARARLRAEPAADRPAAATPLRVRGRLVHDPDRSRASASRSTRPSSAAHSIGQTDKALQACTRRSGRRLTAGGTGRDHSRAGSISEEAGRAWPSAGATLSRGAGRMSRRLDRLSERKFALLVSIPGLILARPDRPAADPRRVRAEPVPDRARPRTTWSGSSG